MSVQLRYSDTRAKDRRAFRKSVVLHLSDDNPIALLPMGYSATEYAGERIIGREGILEVTTKGERFLPYAPGTRAICTREGCVMIDKNGDVTVEVYAEPEKGFVTANDQELGKLEEELRFNGEEEIVSAVQISTPWGFHTTKGTIRLPARKKEPVLRGEELTNAVVEGLSDKYDVQTAVQTA